MGSLILCHNKRARQPYEIARIHMRIYTIEELCYYICNNLYLIDYTMVNRQLCNWIDRELELPKLAERLRDELRQNCTMEQFVLTILRESTIYATGDINKIQGILEHLQNLKDVERMKYKADSLQKSGEYETAILVYSPSSTGNGIIPSARSSTEGSMRALEPPMEADSCMKRRRRYIWKRTGSAGIWSSFGPICIAVIRRCPRISM